MIYLLTGQHPADLPQVNGKIEFKTLVELDWRFHQWLQRTIAPAVSQRFSTAQEALDKLRTIDLNANASNLSKTTEYENITLERTADKLIFKVIGYKFGEAVIFLICFIMLLHLMAYLIAFPNLSNLYGPLNIWFILPYAVITGLCSIKKFQNNFVAILIVEQNRMRFQFKIFKFLLEHFDIIDTNNIVKIEQILDVTFFVKIKDILLDRTFFGQLLILWDGVKQRSIILTDLQAKYVGERLSEWLKVPFEQRRVTYLWPESKSKEV